LEGYALICVEPAELAVSAIREAARRAAARAAWLAVGTIAAIATFEGQHDEAAGPCGLIQALPAAPTLTTLTTPTTITALTTRAALEDGGACQQVGRAISEQSKR
jgi:hypothetical protein